MKNNLLPLIKEALRINLIREDAEISKQLLALESPSDDFFIKLDKRAQEIINEQKRSLSLKKVIITIIAATLIISAMTLTISAVRERVKDFFVETFDGFIKMTTDAEANSIKAKDVTVGYIPEGFVEFEKGINTVNGFCKWHEEDKEISISWIKTGNNNSGGGSGFLDTNDTNLEKIIIDEVAVYRTEKYGEISFCWTDHKMVYSLSFNYAVEWDEVVKIFRGIKITE